MKTPGGDDPFASGIALYVQTYCRRQAANGTTLHVEQIIGALLSVVAFCIEHVPPGDYRRRIIAATHAALDDRINASSPPSNLRH